eukprot:456892_1
MTHSYSHSHGVGMEDILDTVLDDIDHMMSQNVHESTGYQSTSSYSHHPNSMTRSTQCTNQSATSHSFESFGGHSHAMCDIVHTPPSSSQTSISVTTATTSTSAYDAMPHMDLQCSISRFTPHNGCKLQLKDHIFISKDVTYRLSQYLVRENWGNQCSLLYKYLDYIFRCQCFASEVIEIHHESNKKKQFLLFDTGLQRRCDNQFLYALLVPNSVSKAQRWRVQYGNIRNS